MLESCVSSDFSTSFPLASEVQDIGFMVGGKSVYGGDGMGGIPSDLTEGVERALGTTELRTWVKAGGTTSGDVA